MIPIRIQSTPNPNARKYVVNQEIKAQGKVTYRTLDECQHVPLAASIMSIPGVVQIHFFENVLTVTQDGSMDWAKLDHGTQTILREQLADHDIYFQEQTADKQKKSQLSPELQKIDEVLDRTIRPGLQMDGGDVEVIELVGGVLAVRYMGACGSCPSSRAGTLQAMTSILQAEYDENIQIVTVD